MPVLAQFDVKTPVLRETAERTGVDEVRFEDHFVDKSGEIGVRCWVSPTTAEEFESGIEADETVSSCEILTEESSRCLFQVHFSERGRETSFIPLLGEFGGEFLSGEREDGRWKITVRFPDHGSLRGFVGEYQSYTDVSLRVDKIYREERFGDQSFGLTESQREALLTACERGYFNVPREATLKTVAEELGVSDQAISERLRRAQQRLCERVFDER